MAVIFRMPTNVPMEVSESYQRQNTLMYAVMADHLSLGLTNLDNSSEPKVQAGSVFGVNGGLFYVPEGADEAISGTPATGQNYVYAVPNDGGATFQYSATKPVWSATKGGWYNGNNRALMKFFYVSSQYNNKVVLDRQAAMYEVNKVQPLPTSGGMLVLNEATAGTVKSITLDPGFYSYEMKGGAGGKGGDGGSSVNSGTNGATGSEGLSSNAAFIVDRSEYLLYCLGANGNNGNNGSSVSAPSGSIRGGAGGGGAGQGGQSTFFGLFTVAGGKGGNGGAGGSSSYYGGRGGRGGISENYGENGEYGTTSASYPFGIGGAGGIGYTSTSSGYLRIYRCG
jgi:hypothetical protein